MRDKLGRADVDARPPQTREEAPHSAAEEVRSLRETAREGHAETTQGGREHGGREEGEEVAQRTLHQRRDAARVGGAERPRRG